MQCDLSVMISADLYNEFVIPELKEQMGWNQYPVYHFDGKEQRKPLDYILALEELKMIQWTNVEGLYIHTTADSKEEAEEIIKYIENHSQLN